MGDDDQFRHYLPLLRRIIILVAVLTAVPVILWTITAFVRTYVGPPKLPTFRPMAAAATMDTPAIAAPAPDASVKPLVSAQQAVPAAPPPSMVEARATATDARSPWPAAAKGPLLGDRSTDGNASAPAGPASGTAMVLAAPTNADSQAAQMPAAASMPDGTAQGAGAMAAQEPSDQTEPPPDAMSAAEPLAGPIPLPRHRPRYFAMVQVPMPRARPEGAGPSASEAPPGPLNWLQKIFQPPQQQ